MKVSNTMEWVPMREGMPPYGTECFVRIKVPECHTFLKAFAHPNKFVQYASNGKSTEWYISEVSHYAVITEPERKLRKCPSPVCPSHEPNPPPGWETPHLLFTCSEGWRIQCNCGMTGPIKLTELDAKEAWGYE